MNKAKPLVLLALLWVLSVTPFLQITLSAPVAFAVDPAESQVTLSGNLEAFDGELSATISAQQSGSLTAYYAGYINVAVSNTTIEFTGSSSVEALTNSLPQQPAPGGSTGSAPADYGGMAQKSFFGQSITVDIALRNVVLDLTSGMLTLNNGGFNTAALQFSFSTNEIGTIDYLSPSLGENGSDNLVGDLADASSMTATLTTNSEVQILTIPVNMTFTPGSGALDGSTLNMVGQIVATNSLALPLINSIEITNQTVTLSVANVTAQSQVLVSTNLDNWQVQTATVTNLSGLTIFVFPVYGNQEFFRVQR
ncbi:MAG: hypothetical protein ABSF34_00935 [Verrucomicrobiota bacterium]|jgi:hypothetical protein